VVRYFQSINETIAEYSPMMRKSIQLPHLPRSRLVAPSGALIAFERAAARLSFRRAAQDLSLTPSAVSHQIRGLEEQFGVRLFARAGRSVRLTTIGEAFLRSVSQALLILEDAGRELIEGSNEKKHELRVSALPFFTHTVIIPALASFQQKHSDINLRFEATNRYADFDANEVDVAIRYGRENTAGLRLEPLIDVRLVPVCSPRIAKLLRSPSDLAQHALIGVSAQPNSWRSWLDAAGLRNIQGARVLSFDSVMSALAAAEHSLGVTLAMHPLITARAGYGKALIVPFDVPVQSSQQFYFVCRPEQAGDRPVLAFKQWLIGAVRSACRGQKNSATLRSRPNP
jgi:LysR family transcriptional regulator, glycine cleavage system transcriptional activator